MEDVSTNFKIIENADYAEERDEMYSFIGNNPKRRAIAGGLTILGGIGSGIVWKQRKKIKKNIRNIKVRNLKRRKKILERQMFDVDTKLEKYTNNDSKTTDH